MRDEKLWQAAGEADNDLKLHAHDGHHAVSSFIGNYLSEYGKEMDGGFWEHRTLEDAIGTQVGTPTNARNGASARALSQINHHFAPVKAHLESVGPTVRLYRNENIDRDNPASRSALSWTADRGFAEHLNRGGEPAPFVLYDVVENDGEDTYMLEPSEVAEYLGIFEDEADALPTTTRSQKKAEALAQRLRDATGSEFSVQQNHDYMTPPTVGRIREEDIPVGDVVWVSNRSNQREFIVRNRERQKRENA